MADNKKQKQRTKRDRLKPLSLHPLTLEKALSAFMRVKPKNVKVRGPKHQTGSKERKESPSNG